ncbi:D-amino acid dehydrogenase [Pusillimonas sp. DMV24BSW_D]|uniref:D-amino acid dehydrogenase n=1 Tax=Neopusillimonas aestuarii TaxID=2716226 RepID=UPI00140B64BB|nr:D-amino acid dehydrogenase [Pusillimonas sp. DMV24BSW_D]QIM49350.1 D-amino acid dehydrogenase [Pusillimonas sp. DMV24BSW_D]
MKVVVLGSGIIGVASAWWLKQAGHDVVVIDRQPGPAQETSRANGCQISVSYAEPWANPQTPMKLLKWLLKDSAPMVFRPQADWRQWAWGLQFLLECRAARVPKNIRSMVALAEYSLQTLKSMREELGIEYNHLSRGILNFYRNNEQFDASQQAAGYMRDYGLDRRIVSKEEVLQIEPALSPVADSIVGGDYTELDESGDVYLFTSALAKKAEEAGVEFRFSTQINRLTADGGKVTGVEVVDPDGTFHTITGDAYVAALGSFTPHLVSPLGVSCPVYPAKGYSATFKVVNPDAAPVVSLTDSEHKVVFSRLGDSLRMAGTAELAGYSRSLNTNRCRNLVVLAHELFPSALDFDNVAFWSGLRPSTPSNVPLIGRTRVSNLYLNTGHGTLGWTMGVGSGRVLADLVSGQTPEPDFPFLG